MIGTVAFASEREQIISIFEGALQGLIGIDGYSHLLVLTTAHIDPVIRGVFSRRNGARPSGMNVWVVEVIGRDEELLKVRGLGAEVGTRVVDLMPYEKADAIAAPVEPK